MTAASGSFPNDSSIGTRDREILRDVIYAYILSGVPVSSRSLARSGRHGLSSASIRNVMADLEDMGYLQQPHTSAGRVPTDRGYHFYIERLMQLKRPSAKERKLIDERLDETVEDADDCVERTSSLLSELSSQVGIVVTPAVGGTTLRSVDFIPISDVKVLCVVVAQSGFVDHKVIELEQKISPEDLRRASNYLTEHFHGRNLNQVRDELIQAMEIEKTQVDGMLTLTLEFARKGLSEGSPALVLEGTAGLLNRPELHNLDRVRRLLDAFKNKARLVNLVNQCVRGGGVRVFIGEDSEFTSELDFSLVATNYRLGDRTIGSIGILGPSRMQYARVIPLVDYLADRLSSALAAVFGT